LTITASELGTSSAGHHERRDARRDRRRQRRHPEASNPEREDPPLAE
jgi:hypothetical protein